MKHTTKTGQIPTSVGFSQTSGNITPLTKKQLKDQKAQIAAMQREGNRLQNEILARYGKPNTMPTINFRSMQAIQKGDKIISYATHVATIDPASKAVKRLGYWSKTTSRHINHAARELGYKVTD